jgi:hypothetical protein
MLGGPVQIADASASTKGTWSSVLLHRARRSRQPSGPHFYERYLRVAGCCAPRNICATFHTNVPFSLPVLQLRDDKFKLTFHLTQGSGTRRLLDTSVTTATSASRADTIGILVDVGIAGADAPAPGPDVPSSD